MWKNVPTSKGFTFLETLFAVAVGALVLIALSLLLARVVGVNRYDYEQILITENARLQIGHMTDAIRDALTGPSGWLVSSDDYSLHIMSDAGGGVSQEILYQLSGTDLTQTIIRPNATQEVTVLSHNIRNQSMSKPIFTFYNLNGQQLLASSATSNAVRRVDITLEIDSNPNQLPDTVEVATTVIPRSVVGAQNIVSQLPAATLHYTSDVNTNATVKADVLELSGNTSS